MLSPTNYVASEGEIIHNVSAYMAKFYLVGLPIDTDVEMSSEVQ